MVVLDGKPSGAARLVAEFARFSSRIRQHASSRPPVHGGMLARASLTSACLNCISFAGNLRTELLAGVAHMRFLCTSLQGGLAAATPGSQSACPIQASSADSGSRPPLSLSSTAACDRTINAGVFPTALWRLGVPPRTDINQEQPSSPRARQRAWSRHRPRLPRSFAPSTDAHLGLRRCPWRGPPPRSWATCCRRKARSAPTWRPPQLR